MNRKVWHLFALLLCAVMLCVMLPATATAVEFEVTKSEMPVAHCDENGAVYVKNEMVITDAVPVAEESQGVASAENKMLYAIEDNGMGQISFDTIDELRELASRTYDSYVDAYYMGEEPLVIDEELILPENLGLIAYNAVEIRSGAVFSTQFLYAQRLSVDGTLRISGNMTIEEELAITGKVEFNGYNINLGDGCHVVGESGIEFAISWATICWRINVETSSEFVAAAQRATENTNTRYQYELTVLDNELTLDQSVELPYSAAVSVQNKLTIAEGVTLTARSNTSVVDTLVVNGTLQNEGSVDVIYDEGGRLVVGENGTYSGPGYLRIYSNTLTAPDAAASGLDLSQMAVTKTTPTCWECRSLEGLTQLGIPQDLKWGYAMEGIYNPETDMMEQQLVQRPGSMMWSKGEPNQNQFLTQIYREGEETPVHTMQHGYGSRELENFDSPFFITGDFDSGNYYFTVKALGDYVTYYDSEVAVSDVWAYTKPENKLGSFSNLHWEWPMIMADGTNGMGGYEVEVYYAPDENSDPFWIGGMSNVRYDSTDVSVRIPDFNVQQCGDGYYYFKIRGLSGDITQICNGDWSELSPAYALVQANEEVKSELGSVVENTENMTSEEIKEAVNSIDNTDLKSAMLADQDNTGVVEQISALEEAVGVETVVAVDNAATAIDQSKVSIVGAGLNTLETEGEDITLNIGAPENPEHVIPELYDSTVAVRFSMDLDNVANTEELEVPVKITLPVPANINPNFLVILHYHADGNMEEVHPYIYTEGSQVYAAFVLTSFSDFILTEEAPEDYYVTGVAALCGSAWDVADENNRMSRKDDGTYEKVFTNVPAGNHSFQITDGTWNNIWADNGYAIEFKVTQACDVTITFDAQTGAVTVSGEYASRYEELEIEKMIVVGTGSEHWLNGASWDPNCADNAMEETSEGVYEITYTDVPAGSYELKFAANGNWVSNWGGTFAESGAETNAVYNSYHNIAFDVEAELADVALKLDLTGFNFATRSGAKFTVTITADEPEGEPSEPDEPYVNPFTDIKKSAYYYDAVLWAVNKGITNGYGSDTIFAPDMDCTRGQVVTFLWRAAGEPEPSSSKNPFKDVKTSDFFYKAVLWAVEEGITAGYGANDIFNPDGICNRGQVATFLHRYAEKPAPGSSRNPFTDVKTGAFYYDAVLWAVEQGITNGYGSDTIFNPDGNCTRGQIVTFLYRAIAE